MDNKLKPRVLEEVWLPVDKFEHYEVSNLGRVRSIDRDFTTESGTRYVRKGEILKLIPEKRESHRPYLRAHLWSNAKSRLLFVHRLVAEAFIGPVPDGYVVDHIDNDPQNNAVENLQIITAKENINRQEEFGNHTRDRVKAGTHNNSAKTQCPRGHQLEAPNLAAHGLKKGKRVCLACQRARGRVARKPERAPFIWDISNEIYREIVDV